MGDELKCDYCDHVFTDEELESGENRPTLRKIELRCPKCGAHNVINFRDMIDLEDKDVSNGA